MVGPQVVDLLLVHAHPEVFADKLHCVQLVLVSWAVLRYPDIKCGEKEKIATVNLRTFS